MLEHQTINDSNERSSNIFSNITKTVILGFGRILSVVGLVNQGMQEGFSMLGVSALASKILSGIASLSTAGTNSVTRFKAIYDDFIQPNNVVRIPENFSNRAKIFMIAFKGISIIDAVIYMANCVSAVVQLECYYINEQSCKNGFKWRDPYFLGFLPLGLVCGLSVAYCFWKFNFKKVASGNVRDFIYYCDNFRENLKNESVPILGISLLLTAFGCASVTASNYFSTAKMLSNFLGKPVNNFLFQTVVWTSVGCGITVAIFSSVAEAKKMLTQLKHEKCGYFKKWSCEGKDPSRAIIFSLSVPVFVADTLAHGITKYPGTILILNSLFTERNNIKKSIAFTNAITGGILYFSLNSKRAIDIVAGSDIKKIENFKRDQKQDVPYSQLIKKHGFLGNTTNVLDTEQINETSLLESEHLLPEPKKLRSFCNIL